jgi:hypothetical protein
LPLTRAACLLALLGCGAEPRPGAGEPADEEALLELAAPLARLGGGRWLRFSSEERPGAPGPEAFPILARGNKDMNNFVCRSPDAVVLGPQIVPHHVDLPACADPVRGFVLARVEGSGRLARVWLTTGARLLAPGGPEVLRVYVDGELLLETPLDDALSGAASELFAPPFGAGSAGHLAWYYPVVFGERLVVTLDRLASLDLVYYQVDVLVDDPPRRRRAAGARLAARDEARAALEGGADPALAGPLAVTVDGEALATRLEGPATITSIAVRGAERERLTLEAVWDGGAQALRVPLALVDETLALPMPFARSAELRLVASPGAPVEVELEVAGRRALPEAPWGHLTAEVAESAAGGPPRHAVAAVSGRGRLAAVCVALDGHGDAGYGPFDSPFLFLEGDERLVVDGRALAGTGTEDLFDSSFYFARGPFVTPFARAWRVANDGARAGVSACRVFRGATVDFAASLEIELEIGPDDPALRERYRSAAFVYR